MSTADLIEDFGSRYAAIAEAAMSDYERRKAEAAMSDYEYPNPMSEYEPQRAKETDYKAQYPGFTITCDKCGGTRVLVEDSRGSSHDSGVWGSVALACETEDCGQKVEIAEA
jgi:hypothetical protein